MSRKKKRAEDFQFYQLEQPQKTFYERSNNQGKVQALTEAQGQYISQILTKDIVFGVGPAGTGKTYVAAAMAADALSNHQIESIVICRPMVGCDEDMGFLPGKESEKYEPWIEPIISVLEERLGKSQVRMFLKNGKIQAKPLMLMRGKTHRNSWVLLDEAQNTTPGQMKMFLTRIGEGSKIIIDGDLGQSDLIDGRRNIIPNGLRDAIERMSHISKVGIVRFDTEDIVRHGIIKEILKVYADDWH